MTAAKITVMLWLIIAAVLMVIAYKTEREALDDIAAAEDLLREIQAYHAQTINAQSGKGERT